MPVQVEPVIVPEATPSDVMADALTDLLKMSTVAVSAGAGTLDYVPTSVLVLPPLAISEDKKKPVLTDYAIKRAGVIMCANLLSAVTIDGGRGVEFWERTKPIDPTVEFSQTTLKSGLSVLYTETTDVVTNSIVRRFELSYRVTP
jgi:hypothetical protein